MYNLYERRKQSGIQIAQDKLFLAIYLSGFISGILFHIMAWVR